MNLTAFKFTLQVAKDIKRGVLSFYPSGEITYLFDLHLFGVHYIWADHSFHTLKSVWVHLWTRVQRYSWHIENGQESLTANGFAEDWFWGWLNRLTWSTYRSYSRVVEPTTWLHSRKNRTVEVLTILGQYLYTYDGDSQGTSVDHVGYLATHSLQPNDWKIWASKWQMSQSWKVILVDQRSEFCKLWKQIARVYEKTLQQEVGRTI